MTDAFSPSSTQPTPQALNAIIAAGGRFSEAHKTALANRGINLELATKLGWKTCAEAGELIEIPYLKNGKQVNFKRRTLGQEKKFFQQKDGVKCVYNLDVIATLEPTDSLIITEGEMDCMIALQCGFKAVSVPDGAPPKSIEREDAVKYEYLSDIPEKITVILAVDDDEKGHNLLHDLSLRIGKARCRFVQYPQGCKDLNDVWLHYGEDMVCDIIRDAPYVVIDGLVRMSELPPAPSAPALHNGINGISHKIMFRKGDFSVLTGYAGQGKSTFANELMANMADNHGWRTCVASFEQNPTTDHRRALRTLHIGKLEKHMNDAEKKQADEWIDQNFVFIVPPEFTDQFTDIPIDINWLLQCMAGAVIRYHVDMIIVDPWNEIEHDIPYGMTETRYIGVTIKMLKKFARKYHVHVMVVAHPSKPMRDHKTGEFPVPSLYSVSDSAHWSNKPDLGIIIHGNSDGTTKVKLGKSRYRNILGTPDEYCMDFNQNTGRLLYRPDLNEARA